MVTESGEKFNIYMNVDFLDMRDPAREGITRISVVRDDETRALIGYYWKEYSDIAGDTGHSIMDKIDARDTEGLRSMFCEQSQARGNLDSQLEAIIASYEGTSLRGKPKEPNKANIRYDGRRDFYTNSAEAETVENNVPVRIFINGFIDNIMTDADKIYTIRFSMYIQNDADPGTVSISQITFIRSDGKELVAGELICKDGEDMPVYVAYS